MVGFMGAGKSTVGRLLALRLGWSFIDLDEEIVRDEGRTISEIFEQSGELYFRKNESRFLRTLSVGNERVIALGGGAYVDFENRDFIESNGISIYLEASLSQIRERISDDGTRPLFSDNSCLDELYDRRCSAYRMARVRIDTDRFQPDEAVQEIMHSVESFFGFV